MPCSKEEITKMKSYREVVLRTVPEGQPKNAIALVQFVGLRFPCKLSELIRELERDPPEPPPGHGSDPRP